MPTPSETPAATRRLIALGGVAVILLALVFGALSLSRFQAAEVAWEEHSARATAIG